MDEWSLIAITCGMLFMASFTRSTIGFGDSLLAMPVLVHFLGLKTASPIVALTASTIGISILRTRWKEVEFGAVKRLIISSMIGIPIGVWGIRNIPEHYVKGALGVVLMAFGLYSIFKPKGPKIGGNTSADIAGFLAGILGGAYNLNGGPIAIYGSLAQWNQQKFVATMQGYFLPTGLFIVIGHGVGGLWSQKVFTLFGYAFLLILLGVYLGGKLNKYIKPGTFDLFVYIYMVIMGGCLLLF